MKSSARNLFLIIAVLFLGVAMPNFAHASAFSGYTCDLKNMEPSQRPASGVFLNLEKVRIFVNVGPLEELNSGNFSKNLKPDYLGELIRKRVIDVFSKCFDDPREIDVAVVKDPSDPAFEKADTLGLYVRLFIENTVSTDPKTPKMAHFKVFYYRQNTANRFSDVGQMPSKSFLVDYADPKLGERIEKLMNSIRLY